MAEDIKPSSMFAEEDGSVIGYMCEIDFDCEIGSASGGSRVYPSIQDLKENHHCWETCGIVEVKVFPVKYIHKGTSY